MDSKLKNKLIPKLEKIGELGDAEVLFKELASVQIEELSAEAKQLVLFNKFIYPNLEQLRVVFGKTDEEKKKLITAVQEKQVQVGMKSTYQLIYLGEIWDTHIPLNNVCDPSHSPLVKYTQHLYDGKLRLEFRKFISVKNNVVFVTRAAIFSILN